MSEQTRNLNYSEGFNIKNILKGNKDDKSRTVTSTDVGVLDSDWVKSRFMVGSKDLPPEIAKHRFRTTASMKFTDSSLGGNVIINPRPQFTRYCDIRSKGLVKTRQPVTLYPSYATSSSRGIGMGRYYSEAIDDNQQAVFMEFGMPKFNSLKDFFLRAVDYADSVLANTGRPSIMYKIGQGIGAFAMLAAFPLITMTVYIVKSVSLLFATEGDFKYYYLQPNMQLYWNTVNTIINQIATEIGILNPVFMASASEVDKALLRERNSLGADEPAGNGRINIGKRQLLHQEDIDEFKKMIPGIIGDNNYIDIFAIVSRSQAIANTQRIEDYRDIADQSDPNKIDINYKPNIFDTIDHYTKTINMYNKLVNTLSAPLGKGDEVDEEANAEYLAEQERLKAEDKLKSEEEKIAEIEAMRKENIKSKEGNISIEKPSPKEMSKIKSMLTVYDSTLRQGGAYAVFGVDYTGSVSESFSNSDSEINLSGKAKAMSKKARDIKFDLAGGNIVDGMDSLLNGVKDLAAGVLDSVSFGLSNVISTMTGGAYVEIPKKWEDSSVSLPSVTYNMQLVSPYGNTLSQLQNIYIPLAMLLAGTLPLAAGKSSYTSPFLCSLYSKGVQNIKLGVISSLTITRGTSNLGFDKNRRALAMDVSFTVTDFSTMIAAPINGSGFSLEGLFSFSTEDDTTFGNYISVITSRDLLTNKYATRRFKLKLSRKLMNFEQAISPASFGMRMASWTEPVLGTLVSTRSLTDNYN